MHSIPHAMPGMICPQFKKDVSKVCHKCKWWMGLTWKDERGETHHKWECAMVMVALTNVDVVKATNGTQAATESFRNEMILRTPAQPMTGATNNLLPNGASTAPMKLIEQAD